MPNIMSINDKAILFKLIIHSDHPYLFKAIAIGIVAVCLIIHFIMLFRDDDFETFEAVKFYILPVMIAVYLFDCIDYIPYVAEMTTGAKGFFSIGMDYSFFGFLLRVLIVLAVMLIPTTYLGKIIYDACENASYRKKLKKDRKKLKKDAKAQEKKKKKLEDIKYRLHTNRDIKDKDLVYYLNTIEKMDSPNAEDVEKAVTALSNPRALMQITSENHTVALAFVKKAAELVKNDPSLLSDIGPKAKSYIDHKDHRDRGPETIHTDKGSHGDEYDGIRTAYSSGDCHDDKTYNHTDFRESRKHEDSEFAPAELKQFKPCFEEKKDK